MSKLIIAFILFTYCKNNIVQNISPKINYERTKAKAKEALKLCKQKSMNTEFCILIDMSLHSGVQRLVVWNFSNETILFSGLVSHGCCDNPWGQDVSKDNITFKNIDGSHCSSLGKYLIGVRGYSNWGINIKYLLHGLDKTNSKAREREIVFHSWNQVPENEIYPNGTPEGWGCPAVSNNIMKQIDKILKSQKKSVLMWIYK